MSDDGLNYHIGMMFTTRDQDHDERENANCAKQYYGACTAWWLMIVSMHATSTVIHSKYTTWYSWKDKHEALNTSLVMMHLSLL